MGDREGTLITIMGRTVGALDGNCRLDTNIRRSTLRMLVVPFSSCVLLPLPFPMVKAGRELGS